MFPKRGTVLPDARKQNGQSSTYAKMVATALQSDLGKSHRATKTVMRWTGASERTVRNWLTGTKGPSGEHLIVLIRHSETVLEMILGYSGRERSVAAGKLIAARDGLHELLGCINLLIDESE